MGLGALLGADWWICLPEDKTAQYVGRQSCAECHPEQTSLWDGSDHDRAIDLATSQTVLGDFDDRQFTHVPFEDVIRLSDRDLRTVIENVEAADWATALDGAGEALRGKILGGTSKKTGARLTEALGRPRPVRPCDVIQAQQQIGDVIRGLKRDGRIATDFAVTSKMSRRGEKFFVTTDNRDGKMETFPIKYTFGVRPLQQYLVEFPDGRVQCLPIAWDTRRKQWFHLYPGEKIPADDVLHWTRPLQNWNYMCAECHSTNLRKKYDPAANGYHTTFSEIDVSCEACHGPGSLHDELARSRGFFWDRRRGYGLPSLKAEDSRVQIDSCAPCHSRRRIVYPGFRPGDKFLDYYLVELLDRDLYYADGQILEEDYVYGSFIQSRMYYQQNVRCTDCHDPHTARVKFTDNRLCRQCHVSATYDTPTHHYHPDSSKPGTLCVECHMPETTYMVADPRRDHSLRVPRPDLTVSLGIPNACGGCHHDESKGETAQWALGQVEKWYGKRKGPPHFAHAIDAGRKGEPQGEQALADVIRRKDATAMVRASAILLLSRYPGTTATELARRGLKDPEGLVRVASVRALQFLPLEDLYRRLTPTLTDPLRAVRTEAARILSRVPQHKFAGKDRRAFDAALAEYIAGQRFLEDQPAAHLNMAVVHANLGQIDKAEEAYLTALRIDPDFVPVRVNLAIFYDQQGKKDEAERQARKVVELEPESAEAHYSLGLLVGQDEDRLEEALEHLRTAAKLAPQDARKRYNYALALQKLDRPAEAEKELAAAHELSPRAPDFLHALAILYMQQKRWPRAIACAEELIRLRPEDPSLRGLLEQIRRESAKGDKEVSP